MGVGVGGSAVGSGSGVGAAPPAASWVTVGAGDSGSTVDSGEGASSAVGLALMLGASVSRSLGSFFGQKLPLAQDLVALPRDQEGAPAAGPRIPGAGAVGMHDHPWRAHAWAGASRNSRGSLKETSSSRSVTFSTVTL